MAAIDITQLIKIYAGGVQALQGIDLRVQEGDFCALLGANGAGKTTIIGILTGLVNKTSGQASVFGFDIHDQPLQARAQIGVVPQEMNFNLFEKVEDIVINQAGYFGIPRRQAVPETARLLKKLDLWGKRQEISKRLSGGMKRRLMIARALVTRPRLLILDEPTAGVDVELRRSMWDFLRELNAEGLTILLTTHYLEEVEQLCRSAAIIKDGMILTHQPVRDLVNLVEHEIYVFHVTDSALVKHVKGFTPRIIDTQTFEIELHKKVDLNAFIQQLMGAEVEIIDMRPKGHRMEQLFLHLLKGS